MDTVGQRYFNDNEVKNALSRTNSNNIEELLGIKSRFEKKDKPQIQKCKVVTPAKKVSVYKQKSNVSSDNNKIKETVSDFHADKLADYPASTRKPLTFWQWLKSLFGF